VSNSLTVVRAQDGSSANSFQVGARVDMRVNAASINELRDEASEISIADAGGYYTGTDVEAALQEAAVYNQGGAGAVTRIVQARLQDYVSVKDFGAVGDGVTDDTAALQAAIDWAFNNGTPLYIPPANSFYRVTSTLVCDTAVPNDRTKGLTIFGVNGGNPFTHPNSVGGSSSIQGTMDAPVFKLTGYVSPAGRTTSIHLDGLVFAGNSATAPVVLLEGMYSSEFRNFVIFQAGDGDGLDVTYAVTSVIEDGYIMNADRVVGGLGASRTGTALKLEMERDAGLGIVKRVTARGFLNGFTTGDASATGTAISVVFEDCECSYIYDNVVFGPKSRYCTVSRLFSEGNEGGTIVKMDGFCNRAEYCMSFGGSAVCIDFLPTSKACLALNNNFDVGSDGVFSPTSPIGIRLAGVSNRAAYNNLRQGGSIENSIGILAGNSTTISYGNNTFEPVTWLGAGSAPVSDISVDPANVAAGRLQGFGQQTNNAKNAVFPSLQEVSISQRWEDAVLTEASVDNTPRLNTMHLSSASVMRFTPSVATSIRSFEARNLRGKQFWLLVTNGNATFINNDLLRTHTGAGYTTPAGGAWLSFVMSRNGIAILQSATAIDLSLVPIN